MPMDRATLLTRLLSAYTAYYDVKRVAGQEPFVATAFFHVHGVKYVLVQKAQLWAADNNEFVFFFSCPHLTVELYEQCLKQAYEMGSPLIQPDENHMSSYIVALFLCDSCDPEAQKRLKKCRMRKSFQFSLKGWMEVHTAMIDLGMDAVTANSDGRKTAEFLKTVLHPEQQRKKRRLFRTHRK